MRRQVLGITKKKSSILSFSFIPSRLQNFYLILYSLWYMQDLVFFFMVQKNLKYLNQFREYTVISFSDQSIDAFKVPFHYNFKYGSSICRKGSSCKFITFLNIVFYMYPIFYLKNANHKIHHLCKWPCHLVVNKLVTCVHAHWLVIV